MSEGSPISELVFRRVAGGREPVLDVLRCQDPEPALIWRSRGAAVGRFSLVGGAAARVLAAAAAVGSTAPPGAASPRPADRVAEYLTLDGVALVVPAATAVDGPWGELLAACRAAVDDPGEPVAAVTLVAEPPARVHLEHRGMGSLELGFGALTAAIRWTHAGIETGYAGARVEGGVVTAGPGWSTTIELDVTADASPAGKVVATASLSIRDAGVWIPVTLEAPVPA